VAIYDRAAGRCANGGDVVEEDACSHVGSIEPNPFVANVMQGIADASVREAYGQGDSAEYNLMPTSSRCPGPSPRLTLARCENAGLLHQEPRA
jgi:hypothetical protein